MREALRGLLGSSPSLINNTGHSFRGMNIGYGILGLGILGVIVGAAMYLADWHRTIGLGGIGLGIVLIVLGAWLSRKAKPVPQTAPAQTSPAP